MYYLWIYIQINASVPVKMASSNFFMEKSHTAMLKKITCREPAGIATVSFISNMVLATWYKIVVVLSTDLFKKQDSYYW